MTREQQIAAIRANEVIIGFEVAFESPPGAKTLTEVKDWCTENVGPKGDHPMPGVWGATTRIDIRQWAIRAITPDIGDTTIYYAFWFARPEDAVHFALRWKGET